MTHFDREKGQIFGSNAMEPICRQTPNDNLAEFY